MAATKQVIDEWFERGVSQKDAFMIVVCDTYDYDDYPVFTSKEGFWEKYDHYTTASMQRIMEVYDLKKSKTKQLNEKRSFNMPKK